MIELSSYVVTDPFFGPPYIDLDEERDSPTPHRHLHGGFEGTSTRFRIYFPGSGYEGRMLNPLSGGNGGTEDFFGNTALGDEIGGISMCFRLGGYMVESNQGHIGDELDPKGGPDPTLYGHRASAEVARLSKHIAAQIYGAPPHHSYVFGGSGGGRRSPLCLENAPDAWDAALPFVGGGDIAEHGNTKLLKGAQSISFATMFNVQRLLGDKIERVVDAAAPGGSGDPFDGLDTHQREELAALYRLGFPRGDELMIGKPLGQMWLWASMADALYEQEPEYFDGFWSEPGYVGHDQPALVVPDLIDGRHTVSRVLTATDILEMPEFASPEYQTLRLLVRMMAQASATGFELPVAVEVRGVGRGYRLGTGVRVVTGGAAGRQLYCMGAAGDIFFCDGRGEASNLRFGDVLPGDEVHVDNHRFLAYCYYTRHHLMDDLQFDFLRVDGVPVYPQHSLSDMSPLMGVCYSGQFRGKLMWVHHTHDASLWQPQGVVYADAVHAAQGEAGADERFRVRWTENAEHGPPRPERSLPNRMANTWLIDYQPVIEQCLQDLIEWVERGVDPTPTSYTYSDGKVTLPPAAADRGGIQPVVRVTAEGGARAEVRAGQPVTLHVEAEVPPGAGTITSVAWDFDGSGSYPFAYTDIDGTAAVVSRSTTHVYERPGIYFVTALVCSHRDGDVAATARQIPNVAQARVVVA